MTIKKVPLPKLTISGVVTRVELLKLKPYMPPSRYGNPREEYAMKLRVEMDDDLNGKTVFFTPATRHTISAGGNAYCSLVDESDWVGGQQWETKGWGGAVGFGKTPVAKIAIGQRLTIQARNVNGRLSHVKLISKAA